MGISEADHGIVISEEDARGGATGHNVRYVLVWGLTGVIGAFALIGLYFGYDTIQQRLAHAFSLSASEMMRAFAPYAGIVLAGAVMAGLLLGLVNIIAGRSQSASQFGMRLRVITQFALICVIMAILAFSTAA